MGWLNHMAYFYLSILSLIATKSWCLITNVMNENESRNGTRWAVLVAGSNDYSNYRHQADVCHAYQLLKKGGLKDENIIVFMYDDIAFSPENPRPGVIINKPDGEDVYEGVPKDYTGDSVTAKNLYAVLLGNKSALTGGSSKVLDSGPNDHIFIYYADHGSPGLLGMPVGEFVYAKDLVDVLKKKHATKTYKSMVIYIEACESGSIFDGLLPENIGIYATTAANAKESSYATYCVDDFPQIPSEYDTCLGDLYSISWMEDCDKHDLRKETFGQQYEAVRRRTTTTDKTKKSHVMQFGNMKITKDFIFSFMGTNPANDNYTYNSMSSSSISIMPKIVSQRDADLFHFWQKFHRAPEGSHVKIEARKKLISEISKRKEIDSNINKIGKLLLGHENSLKVLNNVRPQGQSLVDDWDCFKMLMRTYEEHCGRLSSYGTKYSRAVANMCNAGITQEHMFAVSNETCFGK